MFGGTQKQNKEREEMEELRREDLKRKREGQVKSRVRQIEWDRAEQNSLERKKTDRRVKQNERKQMVGGGEEKIKFVSTSTERGIEKSELRNNTNLNGGIVKLGSSTFRPAQRTIVGVGDEALMELCETDSNVLLK